jgi:2-dehydro-3-deoxyglucarate aldolase/4-hydroxy-2-oxoheptanedioate aldolase
MLCATHEQAQQWKEAGALLLAYSSDSEVLHGAYRQSITKIKGRADP